MPDGRFLLAMAGLFAVTLAVIGGTALLRTGVAADPLTCAGFFLFTLFAISCRYQHPGQGVVSFDRVAQFSAVLILDPVVAAALNACASFVHPVERLRRGVSPTNALAAGCANGAIMGMAVLLGGLAYHGLNGPVPLRSVTWQVVPPLIAMATIAHVVNALMLHLVFRIRGVAHQHRFDGFSFTLEVLSYLVAIVFVVVWTNLALIDSLILTGLLAVGMLQLSSHGAMRARLERLVEERTIDLHEQSRRLDEMSRTDDLTGLRNRRHAQIRLEEEIHRARRHHGTFCIALADLDHFKQINDRYSHGAGDAVLRKVAITLDQSVRGEDVVARFGGEEFIFIFPEASIPDAMVACERIRFAVERLTMPEISKSLRVSVSIGLVQFGGETATQLLNQADTALYSAKHRGRNRVLAVPQDLDEPPPSDIQRQRT
ncbi:GGDEF domain-containing protein [uncultured Abyssibacter sp.]|uniref:GGDEF domain-containing protein n=1 Tax=uncultured Abyssibacter sp. TaxID=2320202 RepID=UPI0032B133F3